MNAVERPMLAAMMDDSSDDGRQRTMTDDGERCQTTANDVGRRQTMVNERLTANDEPTTA